MKKIIIHMLLFSIATLGLTGCQATQKQQSNQAVAKFKAGETVTLVNGMKLYSEFVNATNLQNVIIYGYDDNDQLKTTARAESADYTIYDEALVRLILYNVTIETKDEDGQTRTINAKLYPISLDRKNAKQSIDPTRKTPAESAKG